MLISSANSTGMKRHQFLRACMGASAVLTLPIAPAAKSLRIFPEKAGYKPATTNTK
jgi:hypothetical protein